MNNTLNSLVIVTQYKKIMPNNRLKYANRNNRINMKYHK